MGGFPKSRGTILGVPIMRTIVVWGLYWGPFVLGDCHVFLEGCGKIRMDQHS